VALPVNIIIDISGQPYATLYLGLISIPSHSIDKITKKFKKKYPLFFRSKQKGSKRKPDELKSIIRFLNENNVRMVSLRFKTEEWMNFLNHYKNKSNLIERVIGMLYVLVLEIVCRQHKSHQIILDIESYMDIKKAIMISNRIAKANKFKFNFSIAMSKTNDLIKFSDFVASAHRKMKKKDLDNFGLFKACDYKLNEEYIKKAFR
tara:strand:+ start:2427 stop:3041 length:615 start_codon:yes stop_codon:yes gene_type:complete